MNSRKSLLRIFKKNSWAFFLWGFPQEILGWIPELPFEGNLWGLSKIFEEISGKNTEQIQNKILEWVPGEIPGWRDSQRIPRRKSRRTFWAVFGGTHWVFWKNSRYKPRWVSPKNSWWDYRTNSRINCRKIYLRGSWRNSWRNFPEKLLNGFVGIPRGLSGGCSWGFLRFSEESWGISKWCFGFLNKFLK